MLLLMLVGTAHKPSLAWIQNVSWVAIGLSVTIKSDIHPTGHHYSHVVVVGWTLDGQKNISCEEFIGPQ